MTEAKLQAAVFADPGPDAPRLVYSDWLQEKGDPRGELIVLQTGKPSPAKTKQIRALIEEHGADWLGSLKGKLDPEQLVFDRGFVSEGVATGEIDQSPAWSTLTSLQIGDAQIAQLEARKAPLWIESLTWAGPLGFTLERGLTSAARSKMTAFAKLTSLPKLKRLTLHGDTQWSNYPGGTGLEPALLSWAFELPLEELRIATMLNRLPAVVALAKSATLQRVVLRSGGGSHYQYGGDSILTRDSAGDFSCLEIRYRSDKHNLVGEVELLGALPPTLLTSLRLIVNGETWKRFEGKQQWKAALARQERLKKGELKAT